MTVLFVLICSLQFMDAADIVTLLVFMMQWQILEKRAAAWRSAQAHIRQDVLLTCQRGHRNSLDV